MGLFGGSKSSSKSTSNTFTETTNKNFQGVSGPVLDGLENSTVSFINSDQGAIDGAFSFVGDALNSVFDAVTGTFEVMTDTQQQALNNMQDTAGQAFELSYDSLDRVSDNAEYFADILEGQNSRSLELFGDTAGQAFELSRDAMGYIENANLEVRDATSEALVMAESATNNALGFASNATKADQGQSQEMIKYALVAVAFIVGVSVWGSKK